MFDRRNFIFITQFPLYIKCYKIQFIEAGIILLPGGICFGCCANVTTSATTERILISWYTDRVQDKDTEQRITFSAFADGAFGKWKSHQNPPTPSLSLCPESAQPHHLQTQAVVESSWVLHNAHNGNLLENIRSFHRLLTRTLAFTFVLISVKQRLPPASFQVQLLFTCVELNPQKRVRFPLCEISVQLCNP